MNPGTNQTVASNVGTMNVTVTVTNERRYVWRAGVHKHKRNVGTGGVVKVVAGKSRVKRCVNRQRGGRGRWQQVARGRCVNTPRKGVNASRNACKIGA